MIELSAAILVFLASHALPSQTRVRAWLLGHLGKRLFFSLYGMMSLALLTWLLLAYQNAPYIEVWEFAEWMRWMCVGLVLIACLFIGSAFTQPNPLSLSASHDIQRFDPDHPGIVGLTRHPALFGLVIWSGAHMIPNGDAASLLMFGFLNLLCLYGHHSVTHKRQTALGLAQWTSLARTSDDVAFKAILQGKIPLMQCLPNLKGIIAGLCLFALLLSLHAPIIGVSPIVLP